MTAHPPDHDATSLRMSFLKAAGVVALLGGISGWVGVTGNASAAVAVARFLVFLCLTVFMILVTFAVIVGTRHK